MRIQNSELRIKNLVLIVIVLLAAFLRLYQLGNNPPSLDWDEASLGYNAYSLLKTGKDEFGRSWPVSIRSFEDYKPAMYTYLAIPTVAIFGLNEFAVRLPSALVGTLTVLACFFLVRKLTNEKIALLTSFLLAISPWHLQFSRVAFESNISLFFVFSGLFYFLTGLRNGRWFLLSAILLSLSFYSYHSPRLVVPLIIFGWTIYYRRELWPLRKYITIAVFVGIVMLIPFFKEAVTVGRARLSSVTIISPGQLGDSIRRIEYDQSQNNVLAKIMHNRRFIYARAVAKGYVDHFNLYFLFLTGDTPDRHHARDMGMLYLWEAPFIVIGMILLLRKKYFPIWWWFFMAPAASALTSGTPHAVRALLYLPMYQVFTAFGVRWIIQYLKKLPTIKFRAVFIGIICLIALNIFYYFQMYYVHTPLEASKDWQYGYKQAVAEAESYESQVDKIIMTYTYDQPHVYVLFYEKIDPLWYQSQQTNLPVERSRRGFGKYEFRHIDWAQDQYLKNTLLIGTSKEIPEGAEGHLTDIYFLDGSVAFRIVKR